MIFFLDIDGVMVHANPHQKVELDEEGFEPPVFPASKYNISSVFEILPRIWIFNIILSSSYSYNF